MSSDSIDNAWKIHAAIVDWTGKVDTKASFALTIESAILAGVITLSGNGRVFDRLHGWFSVSLYAAGVAALVAGVLIAAWVVRPRLRSPNLKSESVTSFVYFGHLRRLDQAAVQAHLEEGNEKLLPVLAKQLVDMSEICWSKHLWVQVSMTIAVIGVALLGLCAGTTTTGT